MRIILITTIIIASIKKDHTNLNWFKKNYLVNFILLKCLADFKKTLLKLS